MKKIILSGMRPTGKLHLGHWVGALSNWVKLQDEYECFFMLADWHALMSEYKDSKKISYFIKDNVADWLSWGIDPQKSTLFIQSQVKEHLELFFLLSPFTPLGWLMRVPTYKEQLKQLRLKEINNYAFLGYPILQAADILLYKANFVPVGEDQLPHLELCRQIIRRFHLFSNRDVFVEPQALLTSFSRLLGTDNRKMSKSYNNCIFLDEDDDNIFKKVLDMFTDPQRLHLSDPGHPEKCNVFSYYSAFSPQSKDEVYSWCRQAKKGCRECKRQLAEIIVNFIAPHREKKKEILKKDGYIEEILKEGFKKAESKAASTLKEVRQSLGIDY